MKNIKAYLRFLGKNMTFTAITVVGFSVSLMFVLLLSAYVYNELSVDSFHENKENLYRVVNNEFPSFSPPCGALFANNVPEIEAYTRLFSQTNMLTTKEGVKISSELYLADSAFFSMFSFPLVKGKKEEVLRRRNSIVLTESFAHTLYGDRSPIGESVDFDGVEFQVTGVMKAIPSNSCFRQVNGVIDFESLADIWQSKHVMESHDNNSFDLYIQTINGSDIFTKATLFLEILKEDKHWVYTRGIATSIDFEPIDEVYFTQLDGGGQVKNNDKSRIYILLAISILIVVLATINYINLSVAQSILRNKEVAIHKLMGSSRFALIMKIIGESFLLCFISAILALLLAFFAEPMFNQLLKTEIGLSGLFSFSSISLLFCFIVLLAVVTGLFPGLIITKIDPLAVVKGGINRRNKGIYTKILVIFQYATSIALLICGFMIVKQTNFLKNHDLGFNKEQIIVIENQVISGENRAAFRALIEAIPEVEGLSYSCGNPVDGGNNNTFEYEGENLSFQIFEGDSVFLKMLGLTVKPTGVAKDESSVILNETAVRKLGIVDDPTHFKVGDNEMQVYGIVDDFNFRDLGTEIGPVMIFNLGEDSSPWSMMIKINGNAQAAALQKIETAYAEFTHGAPFHFEFMDETINQWYDSEKRMGDIVMLFTLLTIIISIMGNYAMALYFTKQRTKEIGVRRVNGATESQILMLLNGNYLKWVLIAFLVAAPISYWFANRWLEGFAYRTDISWWVFVLAGLFMGIIAFLSTSIHTVRGARRNPVEALRYE